MSQLPSAGATTTLTCCLDCKSLWQHLAALTCADVFNLGSSRLASLFLLPLCLHLSALPA